MKGNFYDASRVEKQRMRGNRAFAAKESERKTEGRRRREIERGRE